MTLAEHRYADGSPPDAPAVSDYVLITPARNEEAFIETTIRSVASQTVLPAKWIIVSDGSTDRTDGIAASYAERLPWLELLRMPEHRDRQFAAKAACFNAGYERVRALPFAVIGNLDADISFASDYMAFLLRKFAEMPDLGVAGTPFVEPSGRVYDYRFTDVRHVSGACQLFRRDCFEQIGGYLPVRGGAIDWIAVTTARMKGWRTQTFLEKTCVHHRPMGTGHGGRLQACFRHGKKDYYTGGHPLWQVVRSCFQMTNRPFVAGGLALLLGYVWAAIRRIDRPVSPELMAFHRREQMGRLRASLCRLGGRG